MKSQNAIQALCELFYNDPSRENTGLLIISPENRRYLTGFPSSDGFLAVCRDDAVFFTDSRYIEAAQKEVNADVRATLYERSLPETAAKYASDLGLKKFCYDGGRLTVSQLKKLEKAFDGIELTDLPGACEELRRVKSPAEIANIRAAQQITDAAFAHICTVLKRGMTELGVAAELEYFMRKNGADGLAFETIAVSGPKSSLPHGVPGNVVLTENAFLTMDFGARYNGYCSDMTRTVVLGKADEEMRKIYDIVAKAQKAAIAALRPGVSGKEVDAAARDIITDAGYGKYFGHSTGHSLGLEIHEEPRSSARSADVFVPGQLMTVEPGIYLEGKYGVRIEDLILVTENGHEDLTKSDKTLLEL